jgi:hypothetical protein
MLIADHLPHQEKPNHAFSAFIICKTLKKHADIIRMRHQMIDFKGVGAWRSVIKSALRL